MEKETYKNDVLVAVTLLLCLWFKLDAVIEYGIENISCISIASCILLVIVIMSMALWLLFTNSSKLWAIIKGVFKSEIFDTISWIAFFMPIICIEKYSTYFACASWVFGDIILLSAFLLIRNKYKIKIPEFGISDSRFSCYARFPTGAYYICPPNNMDGKMQNCKVQMKFTL